MGPCRVNKKHYSMENGDCKGNSGRKTCWKWYRRTIPRAIRLTVTTVLALYVTSIAAITIFIPPERVGTSVNPFS